MDTWWFDAFAQVPYEKSPPGEKQMLTVIAYDITDPKRLAKVASVCEDFGVRVQYSIFECHLDQDGFNDLWLKLLELINEDEDRIVALQTRRPQRPGDRDRWHHGLLRKIGLLSGVRRRDTFQVGSLRPLKTGVSRPGLVLPLQQVVTMKRGILVVPDAKAVPASIWPRDLQRTCQSWRQSLTRAQSGTPRTPKGNLSLNRRQRS